MRIAWLITEQNPWTTESGWDQFEQCGLRVQRCHSVAEAKKVLLQGVDLFIVSQDVSGAVAFLENVRSMPKFLQLPTILVSSSWGKKEFKEHSKTKGAAHRYGKTPMPVDGFVGVICDLLRVSRAELQAQSPSAGPADDLLTSLAGENSQVSFRQAANDQTSETLKNYLKIKDDELHQLQTKSSEMEAELMRLKQELALRETELRTAKNNAEDIELRYKNLAERNDGLEKELALEKENGVMAVKAEQERLRQAEQELKEASERHDVLKSRVRKDLRRIRVRERDLESKLELLRTDTEKMLEAREAKVLSLQRKIDSLEFDLDQLQDSRHKALSQAERYLAKLARVSRTLQIALSLIEDKESTAKENAEESLLGGLAEELRVDAEPREADAELVGPAEEFKEISESTANEPDADALLAQASEGADAGFSGSSVGGAAVEEEGKTELALGADLDALASDGEPTRVVSRPVADAPAEENSDSLGKLDLASSVEEAG